MNTHSYNQWFKKTLLFSMLMLVVLFLFARGANSQEQGDDYNMGSITLNVGESATCYAAGSCRVFLNMPEGSKSYVVKQDGPNGKWTAGTFPAGQQAMLGEFYEGRTKFTIEGLDVPATWVTVISSD
jgi:hypothetical protein